MDKIFSGIMGLIIGDAYGVPYEFQHRGTFEVSDEIIGGGTHGQPVGTWSDDTSMVLASMSAYINSVNNKTDLYKEMMDNFTRWYKKGDFTPYGEVFDMGCATRNAIYKYANEDVEPVKCGGTKDSDNGNGSLMRILPFAFTDLSDKEIEDISSLTHAHFKSKVCCKMYICIARRLIKGMPIDEAVYKTAVDYQKELKEIDGFVDFFDLKKLSKEQIKGSGYVVDTLKAALWCLIKTDNYRDCIKLAVSLGEDTDTVAAVAGGLAGIIYGCNNFDMYGQNYGFSEGRGIPFDWFNVIVDRKDIIDLCFAFSNVIRQVEREKYEDNSKFWYTDEIYKVIELLEEAKKIIDKKDKDYGSHIVSSESRLSSSLNDALSEAETIKSVGNVVKKVHIHNIRYTKFIK